MIAEHSKFVRLEFDLRGDALEFDERLQVVLVRHGDRVVPLGLGDRR